MLVKYTYNKLLSVIILLSVLNEELYVVFNLDEIITSFINLIPYHSLQALAMLFCLNQFGADIWDLYDFGITCYVSQ